jgi:hypothetical protein
MSDKTFDHLNNAYFFHKFTFQEINNLWKVNIEQHLLLIERREMGKKTLGCGSGKSISSVFETLKI